MKLYITHPNVGRVYHVFDEDDNNRSLCGRYGMIFKVEDQCVAMTDPAKFNWVKGQDCKPCFRKAGILKEESGNQR